MGLKGDLQDFTFVLLHTSLPFFKPLLRQGGEPPKALKGTLEGDERSGPPLMSAVRTFHTLWTVVTKRHVNKSDVAAEVHRNWQEVCVNSSKHGHRGTLLSPENGVSFLHHRRVRPLE